MNLPTDRNFNLGAAGAQRLVGDWNGDGFDEVGVFTDGVWSLDFNGDGVWDGGVEDLHFQFGWPGATPVVGDWNGDGRAQVGVFANIFGTGIWLLDFNGNGTWEDASDKVYLFGWGIFGTEPVVGDWNGDGRSKIGVYVNGYWFMDANGNGVFDDGIPGGLFFLGGWDGSVPLIGDWNGDGKDSAGIYVNGYFVLDYDGDHNVDDDPDDKIYDFGWHGPGVQPLTGDWTGDGAVKIGVFVEGDWFLDSDGSGGWVEGLDDSYSFGEAGDLPVVGHWAAPVVPEEDKVRPTATTNVQGQTGLPRDIVVKVFFSESMAPATIRPDTIYLQKNGSIVPGVVTLDASGKVVELRPTSPLPADSLFEIAVSPGATDLAGNPFLQESVPFASFGTGSSVSGGESPSFDWPAWLSSTPLPTNFPWWTYAETQVSAQLDHDSFNGPFAQLRDANGQNIPQRSVSYPNDLVPFSTYTLSVQTARDSAGNVVRPPAPITFTTGAGRDTVRPRVIQNSPEAGDDQVPVDQAFTFEFSERVWFRLAGIYRLNSILIPSENLQSADGRRLTIMPVEPLLANTRYSVAVVALDLGGNGFDPCCVNYGTYSFEFTTGGPLVSDRDPPVLLSVNPPDGATNVTDPRVTLNYSEPLQSSTFDTGVALYVDGELNQIGASSTSDLATLTIRPRGILPDRAEIAVVVSSGLADLSGNAASPIITRFTYVNPQMAPKEPLQINGVRPASGATGVASNANIYLFFTRAIDPASAPAAVRVSVAGAPLTGQVSVTSKNRVLRFQADIPYAPGAQVEFAVDLSMLRDADSRPVGNWIYTSMFAAEGGQLGPTVQFQYSPPFEGPPNAHFVVDFDRPMDPDTFTVDSVLVNQSQPFNFALENGNSRLRVVPVEPWPANRSIQLQLTSAVRAIDGSPLSGLIPTKLTFRSEQSIIDTPTLLSSVSPPDETVNVGVNGVIDLAFSREINRLTVDESTVRWTDGSGQGVPCAIEFTGGNGGSTVRIVPHDPFTPLQTYTLTIQGVEDFSGQVVPAMSTVFTAGMEPDFTSARRVRFSPPGDRAPLNAVASMTFDEPLSGSRVNSETVVFRYLDAGNQSAPQPATITLSSDGLTIFARPTGLLVPNSVYSLGTSTQILDVSGNQVTQSGFSFKTGVTVDSTALELLTVAPTGGSAGIPVNHTVALLFDSTVEAGSVGDEFRIERNGLPIAVERLVGGSTVELRPLGLLDPTSSYTWFANGAEDLAGNRMASALSGTFTTGSTPDLSYMTLDSTFPADGAGGVPRNTTVTLRFNQAINPRRFNVDKLQIRDLTFETSTDYQVSYSPDLRTIILTPDNPFPANATIAVYYAVGAVTSVTGYVFSSIDDFAFTTGN